MNSLIKAADCPLKEQPRYIRWKDRMLKILWQKEIKDNRIKIAKINNEHGK